MSLLEQQMQELKLRQRKVALLKTMLELMIPSNKSPVGGPTTSAADAAADAEVMTELKNFTQSMIDSIENGKPMPSFEPLSQFAPEVVEFVNELYTRASQRGVAGEDQGSFRQEEQPQQQQNDPMARPQRRQPPPPREAPPRQRGNKDLLAFAMEHRHLNGKRVIAHTKNGKVAGVVTGCESPNLWVKLDTGHIAPVLPENITLE